MMWEASRSYGTKQLVLDMVEAQLEVEVETLLTPASPYMSSASFKNLRV